MGCLANSPINSAPYQLLLQVSNTRLDTGGMHGAPLGPVLATADDLIQTTAA